jgi:hypothetical protein
MPVLLQALALSKEYRLQYLASETVLNLAYAQVSHSVCIAHSCARELHSFLFCGIAKNNTELSFVNIGGLKGSLHVQALQGNLWVVNLVTS